MDNYLVPVGLSNLWACPLQAEPGSEKINAWLYDSHSLTQKLEALYEQLHLQLKLQTWISSTSPYLSGYFTSDKEVLLREVIIYGDNSPIVFAQTEIPLTTFTQELTQLSQTPSQPLGKILFQHPQMKRSTIDIAQVNDKSLLDHFAVICQQACHSPLWARRSVFHLNNQPLLISELFLPDSGIYQP